MPLYDFENPVTKEKKEIFLKMKEPHVYSEGGIEWNRVYVNPNVSFDSIIKDPYNSKEFAEKGSNKKATIGDWYDQSAELSAKREQREGFDPIKKKYYENYSKNRKGKKHYMQQKEDTAKELDKIGVTLTD